MNKIIRFTYVYPFEFQSLETYLNEMAQKGWLISQLRGSYMIFEKTEHSISNPHYAVGLIKNYHKTNPGIETEETVKCKEFMDEFEYHYICGYGPFLIFEGNSSTPFHNDELVSVEEVKEITKHYSKPLSEIPLILCCTIPFILICLSLSFDLRILFLSDITLWIGTFLLLLLSICVYYIRKPYYKFKKTSSLSDQAIITPLRSVIFVLPLVCLIIFSIMVNSYFLLAFYLLSSFCTMLQRKFYKHEIIITCVNILLLVSLALSDLSIPYAQTKPKEDIAVQLGIPYSSYEIRRSPLCELELYRLGDWNVIEHYVIKDSFMNVYIQQMIEKELEALSSNTVVVRNSYSDIWVFDPMSDSTVKDKIKEVFPGE